MRDAFGGEFMLRIFLIFILIYILFTAVVLNYAKAFKVKDLVISYLEENEITDLEHMPAEMSQAMRDYFESQLVGNYQYTHALDSISCDSEENEYCYEPGIKIKQIKRPLDANKLGVYYKVSAYFGYDIGFLKLLRAGNGSVDTSGGLGFWEVSGETRPIVKD